MKDLPPQEEESTRPLVKEGVVRPGETPSVVSGRPTDHVKRGNAYAKGESTVANEEELADLL